MGSTDDEEEKSRDFLSYFIRLIFKSNKEKSRLWEASQYSRSPFFWRENKGIHREKEDE